MLPTFIVEETTIRESGTGPAIGLGTPKGETLILTFGITRIIEQESIDLSVWGSVDGTDWGKKPLVTFPQKFYCGTYQLLCNLADHPDVKHLRAKWTVNRWGKGDLKPLFGIYLFAQESQPQVMGAGA